MIKGFKKLTSRRSSSSSLNKANANANVNVNANANTNTSATASNSIDSGSDGGPANAVIITKLSNETLEEAYFRLKNEEFQKEKMARDALALSSASVSRSAAAQGISQGTMTTSPSNKSKQKNSRRNKKQKRNNNNSGANVEAEKEVKSFQMSSSKDKKNQKNSTKSLATGVTRNDDGTGVGFDSSTEVHSDGSFESIHVGDANDITPRQEKYDLLKQHEDEDQDGDSNVGTKSTTNTPHKKALITTLPSSLPASPTSPTSPKLLISRSPPQPTEAPRRTMSKDSIKKDESKLKKILIRLVSGVSMVGVFVSFMFCGHIYICTLIFFTEIMLFRELVKVRYNTFFHIIEETIPLFRTTQWMWFVTAIFYTYSDFVVDVIKSNTSTHYLLDSYNVSQIATSLSFLLYSATFVVSIATMHKDHIRFQVNQLCWTILVLCLTVGQLKYIMHNVYNGLIWFALPIMLVVFNDSFAWLGGVTCGRKFIDRELMALSPNKTWEGFVVGWIGTMVAGWHLSRYMAQFTWMTCPTNSFSLFPESLDCELDPIFQKAKHIFPSQIFEVLPRPIVHMIPGVVDICMSTEDGGASGGGIIESVIGDIGAGAGTTLTACVSGNEHHTHHHFELVLKNFYPVQIHALGLSLFASLVAPFGGFLASAIKRAYGLKDFASFIPGHGGMMDRMDCQLLMALCTWVHYNTFVKMATVSLPKMIYMYNNLNDLEQKEFLRRITEMTEGK